MRYKSSYIMATALAISLLVVLSTQARESRALTVVEQELNPQLYKGPVTSATDTSWHDDILGAGFQARQINMGDSYDGPVRCTLVRKPAAVHTRKAVLYVHGFNDYFFQSDMAQRFTEKGYNFYAVDLRRYGRSLQPWQYPFDVRNIDEYFTDLDSALSIVRQEGNTDITLSGHSTGGLTVLSYVAERGARAGVSRVVTDSPFLEWNFNAFYRKMLLPAVSLWGAVSPSTKIKQGHCNAYAESLLKQYHGEWQYNTNWKMIYSPPVKAGWIRAISRAQSRLMKHASHITLPVLVMHSSRGVETCAWDSTCMSADIVLNPLEIKKRGLKMGKQPVVATIEGGIHDLILSTPKVREAAYDTIFNFINTH